MANYAENENNTDKCQSVYFTRRRNIPDPPKLYRRAIDWNHYSKYLGVTLDSKLTYGKHIDNINKKVRAAKVKLYPLIGSNSKLYLRNKLLLYKTTLRPAASYVSSVWGAAAKTHIRNLEATQNIIARQITNAQWFIRSRYLLKDLGLPSIENYFKKLSIKFFSKIDSHTNDALKEIPNRDSHPRRKVLGRFYTNQ
ncbi:putative RNA-directed DNA polymerase from transposon X-element [Araneus ventricosus]|uniref:Putative RNA-directed DNA polymerase from transposon X-element n=1 Tax=Araneus ventricosus TaxID=182803 RepID=A0A4Y2KXM9_ARAVE|nr:putative RNA-directed DNA polymerase from transposon X-element [Araneus ventricosus]